MADDDIEARGWLDGLVVIVHEVLHPQTDDTARAELSLAGHLARSLSLTFRIICRIKYRIFSGKITVFLDI